MKLINEILFDKQQGIDCTEDESAYIKGWLRETTIRPEDGSQQVLEDIQLLFPLEYGEYLDEMEAAPSTPVEDKQTESNKQPLYKVLNEQRTQGVVTITKTKNHFFLEQSDNNGGFDTLCTFSNVHERQEYNAQYTALAVNNLASLAEALEKINNACIKRFEAYAADAAEKKATPPYILSTLAAISEAAKQALQNIS